MITKTVKSIEDALAGVSNNMTMMLGGFGLCGIFDFVVFKNTK